MKFKLNSPFIISIIGFILCSYIRTIEAEKRIILSGSNTTSQLTKALINKYQTKHKTNFNVSTSFKGSSSGIWDLISNQSDITCSSRKIESNEIEIAHSNGVTPIEVIIGYDALSFITNTRLGIDSLSINELRQILSGKITNWKTVGRPNQPITLYGRDIHSGSRQFIEKKLLGDQSPKPAIIRSNAEDIIEAIQKDFGGLGYVGVGNLIDIDGRPTENVWAINVYSNEVSSISPYEISRVKNGEYPFTRPLYQYYNKFPTGQEWDFIQFVLSNSGQEVIQKQGFFPISENHKALNALQGIVSSGYSSK